MFGGLQNFMALDSFERYDPMLDHWDSITLRLPFKIAKMGVGSLEEGRSILVCGGLY